MVQRLMTFEQKKELCLELAEWFSERGVSDIDAAYIGTEIAAVVIAYMSNSEEQLEEGFRLYMEAAEQITRNAYKFKNRHNSRFRN